MSHLVAISIAGLLLWLAVNRIEWLRLARQQYSQTQQALFTELCQAHDLSRTDRTLLSHDLRKPAGPTGVVPRLSTRTSFSSLPGTIRPMPRIASISSAGCLERTAVAQVVPRLSE